MTASDIAFGNFGLSIFSMSHISDSSRSMSGSLQTSMSKQEKRHSPAQDSDNSSDRGGGSCISSQFSVGACCSGCILSAGCTSVQVGQGIPQSRSGSVSCKHKEQST